MHFQISTLLIKEYIAVVIFLLCGDHTYILYNIEKIAKKNKRDKIFHLKDVIFKPHSNILQSNFISLLLNESRN